MMTHNYNTLLISWDFIICDDGCKKINNYKTKRYQAISKIQTKFKILLSDIPLPNKFYDIYSIFNYLLKSSNECFGTYDEFKIKFVTKELSLKSEKSNTKFSKHGNIPNKLLQSYIKYFVLRREKKDFYIEEYQDESEYSEICDDDEDDYKDLDNFIVDDSVYIEDNDIDENDEKYNNINWKEEYYKLNSDLSSEEEININKELIELKLDNENFSDSHLNDYESFKIKSPNYQSTKIFKDYSKENNIKIKNDEITRNINISKNHPEENSIKVKNDELTKNININSDEMRYTPNKLEVMNNFLFFNFYLFFYLFIYLFTFLFIYI
ncbi:hypothetical protein LY90DRAFT_54231 [Neocallimastix californiae]|uniref:SNF2 N-terminal domain-containing protein n=1 Tax=Neocallimastix californiae TaxID=1754190 RepID=A0A1Y2BS01_9FUNG|nr:hypothetical protein LY90DRAFT_54231 [Neocallimastix californiae]|eukprot:ORY37538.1 hypothetical protein LY90DRAFT_54231 [Neocallimastix californiae]